MKPIEAGGRAIRELLAKYRVQLYGHDGQSLYIDEVEKVIGELSVAAQRAAVESLSGESCALLGRLGTGDSYGIAAFRNELLRQLGVSE
jgi:hypothetical protein